MTRSGESPNPDRELIHESLRTEIETPYVDSKRCSSFVLWSWRSTP
jgi:hypothetical protein